MGVEELKAWLPVIGVVVAALLSAAATTTVGLFVFRRAGQSLGLQREQVTGDLHVRSRTAEIEAEKVTMTDRQYQAQREEMVTTITAHMGQMYNGLLKDANDSIDRLRADYREVKEGLAACEARDAECRARLDRIERTARANGWELP